MAAILLSVAAVLPSLLPLLLVPDNIALAIRISNVASFLVIFAAGYSWGIHTDTNPWKTGLLLASICLAMVLVASCYEADHTGDRRILGRMAGADPTVIMAHREVHDPTDLRDRTPDDAPRPGARRDRNTAGLLARR